MDRFMRFLTMRTVALTVGVTLTGLAALSWSSYSFHGPAQPAEPAAVAVRPLAIAPAGSAQTQPGGALSHGSGSACEPGPLSAALRSNSAPVPIHLVAEAGDERSAETAVRLPALGWLSESPAEGPVNTHGLRLAQRPVCVGEVLPAQDVASQNTPCSATVGMTPAPSGALPAVAATELPTEPPPRSEATENIARQADRQIEHGFELVNRQAYYAARSEFLAALRMIAQGLDAEQATAIHSRALSKGLTALKECQDFIPSDGKMEADLDLAAIVGSHRTAVLKGVSLSDVPPISAVRRYLTYAQEQLAAAAGHEAAASVALSAMGQVQAAVASQKGPEAALAEPKAVVFFQAAILAYPQNHLAANELGVLLARSGNYAEAQAVLEQSATIHPTAASLGNLAVVYQQLGERRLAAATFEQSRIAAADEAARRKNAQLSAGGLVQWVSPPALAQAGYQVAEAPPRNAPAAQPAAPPPAEKQNGGWLSWPLR